MEAAVEFGVKASLDAGAVRAARRLLALAGNFFFSYDIQRRTNEPPLPAALEFCTFCAAVNWLGGHAQLPLPR